MKHSPEVVTAMRTLSRVDPESVKVLLVAGAPWPWNRWPLDRLTRRMVDHVEASAKEQL